jgi:hypothetical protein
LPVQARPPIIALGETIVLDPKSGFSDGESKLAYW